MVRQYPHALQCSGLWLVARTLSPGMAPGQACPSIDKRCTGRTEHSQREGRHKTYLAFLPNATVADLRQTRSISLAKCSEISLHLRDHEPPQLDWARLRPSRQQKTTRQLLAQPAIAQQTPHQQLYTQLYTSPSTRYGQTRQLEYLRHKPHSPCCKSRSRSPIGLCMEQWRCPARGCSWTRT